MKFDGYYAAEVPNLGKESEWPIYEWPISDCESIDETRRAAKEIIVTQNPLFIFGYKDGTQFKHDIRLERIS